MVLGYFRTQGASFPLWLASLSEQISYHCPFFLGVKFFNMSGLGDSSSDPANPDSHKRKGSPCDTLASRQEHFFLSLFLAELLYHFHCRFRAFVSSTPSLLASVESLALTMFSSFPTAQIHAAPSVQLAYSRFPVAIIYTSYRCQFSLYFLRGSLRFLP